METKEEQNYEYYDLLGNSNIKNDKNVEDFKNN